MAIKKINTDLQIEAGLLDGDGNSGTNNQILISTGTGIDWVNASTVIGGPYLPLAGGTMNSNATINMNSGQLTSVDYIDFGIGQLNGVSTSNLILKSLGDITYNVDSNNNGNSAHIFQESGNELMRIRYDGKVGIGNNSPSQKLEITGGNVKADEYLYNATDRTSSKNWKYLAAVNAGTYRELGSWRATEGNVVLRITVQSKTSAHSGTAVYMLQAGFGQAADGWYELVPAFKGGGHGNAQDGWKVLWYESTSYTSKIAVAVPTGLANKNLNVSVEFLGDTEGDSYYQYSALSTTGTIPTYSLERTTSYSNKNLVSSDSITAQYDATNYTVLGYDYLDTYGGNQLFKVAGTERLRIDTSGNATFADNITVNGNTNSIATGNTGTFITNDTNNYPRITLTNSSAQIGLFRSGGNAGGMYIGGSADGFRLYTPSFVQKLLIDQSGNATFAGTITGAADFKATGNNLKFHAGGNHILNIDVNGKIYPSNDAAKDLGFSTSAFRFRNGYFTGNVYAGNFHGDGSNLTNVTAEWDGSHTGNASIDGDLTVTGVLTAQEFHTEFVSASILYESGSTQFGDTTDDTHNFTGKTTLLGLGVDADPEDFNNVLTLAANVGPTTNDLGAGLFFKQKWYSASDQLINVGGIVGVKTNSSGNYGGGLAFFAQPNGAGDSFEVMRYNSSGNVGIGTTGPGAKLDVNGNVYINSDYPSNAAANDLTIGKTTTGDHGLTIVTGASNTAGIFFADNNNNDAGRIKYQHSNNSMRFETNRSEAMRITSAGNVGIGTTTPGTVHGASYGTTRLHVDGGTDRGQMVIEGDSFAGIVLSDNGATANQRVFTTSVDDTKYSIKPLNDNGTSTAGGVAVTVLHGGNVGIGTTLPSTKLEVAGHVTINSPTGASQTSYGLRLRKTNSSSSVQAGGEILASPYPNNTNAANLIFKTADTVANLTQRMVIDGVGNVGIGTTAPLAKLQVGLSTTNSGSTLAMFGAANNGILSALSLVNTSGNSAIGYGTALDFHMNSGYSPTARIASIRETSNVVRAGLGFFTYEGGLTEKMRITNNGNVGIGTNSPAAKLHLSKGTGNTYPTPSTNADVLLLENLSGGSQGHSGLTIFSDNGATGNIYFGDEQSNQVAGITCDNTNGKTELFFTTNGTNERLRIDGSGNVGIGTTTPSSKLEVYGSGSTVLDIQGSQGQLFSITDDLSGTLFAVSDISGVPIFEVEANGEVSIDGDLKIKSANITYQENIDVDSAATETVATVNTSEYTGAFFDYTCVKGSNARIGTVMAISVGGSIEFTDNSTTDIGDTSGVTLTVDISGGSMRLRATTTTDDWIIKTLIRTL